MIVQFDATIDEFVDVTMRSLDRTKTVSIWDWQGGVLTALIAGILYYAFFPVSTPSRVITAVILALISGVLYVWISPKITIKRAKRLWREQIGGEGPVRIKAELNDIGITISQIETHTLYEWASIEDIEETNDALYFYKREGTCLAVRKRGFDSEESKDQFVTLAKNYMNINRHPRAKAP